MIKSQNTQLLLHVRGLTTFAQLQTIDGHLCETFKVACSRLNLLEDDAEWRECLRDAIQCRLPFHLCQLFVCILLFCEPADPLSVVYQLTLSGQGSCERLTKDVLAAVQLYLIGSQACPSQRRSTGQCVTELKQSYRRYIHRVPKKGSHCYFLNSSVRHRPILIIFGMQHQE